jgi:hypothetical protein
MATDIRDLGNIDVPTAEDRLQQLQHEERTSAEIVAGGSTGELIGGAGAVVLAIVGLAGIMPTWMAAIGAIALGGALLMRGVVAAARYSALLEETAGSRATAEEFGNGIGAEVVGGTAGIVLGILALLNIAPLVLLPVAAIVFGGTMLLGCGANARVNSLVIDRPCYAFTDHSRRIAGDILAAANGAQALVALGTIVLGIVALLNPLHLMLSLIAFLAAGASVLLSGGAVTGKMVTLLRHPAHRTTWHMGL